MAEHSGKFIAYYRVSTQKQGKSGLGLEAQRKSVSDYLNGGTWELVSEYTEVETGKGKAALEKRPVLRQALEHAKREKATLVIARLDRLARNVAFVSALMESKVDFLCCDFPQANRLTIHILAAVAEYEGQMISERVKAGLQAAKARGTKLGTAKNLKRGNKERSATAQAFAKRMKPTLRAFKKEGLSQRAMCERLNTLGVKTPGGAETWKLMTVQRVLKHAGL